MRAARGGYPRRMSSPPTRVLLVEDDPAIASGLVRALRKEGFEIDLVTHTAGVAERVLSGEHDVLVLDLMLPDASGFSVLEQLQHRSVVPVIVLTARTDLGDRLRSFELGASDYVAKPFFSDELVARIRARTGAPRRSSRRSSRFGAITLDLDARAATMNGAPLDLTKTELNLLAYLVDRPRRAVPRGTLAQEVLLARDEAEARTVDAHVARLRKKLGADGARIATVWGIGYRFEPENEP